MRSSAADRDLPAVAVLRERERDCCAVLRVRKTHEVVRLQVVRVTHLRQARVECVNNFAAKSCTCSVFVQHLRG